MPQSPAAKAPVAERDLPVAATDGEGEDGEDEDEDEVHILPRRVRLSTPSGELARRPLTPPTGSAEAEAEAEVEAV